MDEITPTMTTRTEMVLGKSGVERLKNAHVLIVGLGGVGSYALEGIARAGVGKLTLVDHDTVDITNLNRQLCARRSTLGRYKTDICREHVLDINPDCGVRALTVFYNTDTRAEVFRERPDFVLDCIDSVTAKLDLILTAQELGLPILSALGTGRKLDPSRLRLGDIYETEGDALARVMRYELRKRGVERLRVVCSTELPVGEAHDRTPGSVAWVPGCAGLMMAGECVRILANV